MSVDIVKITAAQSGASAGTPRKAGSTDSADAQSHVSFGATLAARRAQGEAANDSKSATTAKTNTHSGAETAQCETAGQTANAKDLRQASAKSLEADGHPATVRELAVAARTNKTAPETHENAPQAAGQQNKLADTDADRASDPALALDALRARLSGGKPADDAEKVPASETEHARTDDRKKHAATDKGVAELAATPSDPAVAALAAVALPQAGLTTDNKPQPLGDAQHGKPRGRLAAADAKALAATHGKGAATAGEQLAEAARQSVDTKAADHQQATALQSAKADGFERAFAQAIRPTHSDGSSQSGNAADTSSLLAGLHASAANSHNLNALAASAPAQNTAAMSAQINAPVGSDAWSQALSQHSLRLTHFGDGTAELKLHPQELGQLQISLKMGEHAQMHFFSPHADVRAAVEAALPQLRQAFANSGINLGQTSVSDQGANNPSDNPQSRGSSRGGPGDQPLDDVVSSRPVSITSIAGRTIEGGIDIFA